MDNTVLDQPIIAPLREKGHPKGLYVLFATEMWERFNYYGMRAVLVLFMIKALSFDKVFASNLYGSYTSLAYLTSLVGGYFADRYWGNKRSIIAGGLVMAFGEFLLFFCGTLYHSSPGISSGLFYSGLGFVIAGFGFFKPNISSLVGQLYPKNDRRKDSAYTIFYMGINVGAGLGPLVCGYFGDTGNPADFKWAFLAAGIGMLISVVVQTIFQTKYVVDPQGKPLGETPSQSHTLLNDEGKVVKDSVVSKNWLNPFLMTIGLIVFSLIATGLLYIDARVFSYLSILLAACVVYIALFLFLNKGLTS
ncbi:MAG TPA: oligopeptide:H+ symporter, partial [Flavisolibacter sp.]|nr:oligopeptide:H+ symporter [Flavisolibacter sp.]